MRFRLGTAGIDSPPPLIASPVAEQRAECTRRDGDTIVAYPSQIFPFEERVFKRGTCTRSVLMSGIDFFTRRVLLEIICGEVEDRYADGMCESVCRTCYCGGCKQRTNQRQRCKDRQNCLPPEDRCESRQHTSRHIHR
jgi:hypothetical protein